MRFPEVNVCIFILCLPNRKQSTKSIYQWAMFSNFLWKFLYHSLKSKILWIILYLEIVHSDIEAKISTKYHKKSDFWFEEADLCPI